MSDAWTFGGVAFTWLRQELNGVAVRPGWRRSPRLVVRPILGTGDADIATVGYTPYTISGGIFVASDAEAGDLAGLSGLAANLSDGTTTWTAVGAITLQEIAPGEAGWTGEATFTRGGA